MDRARNVRVLLSCISPSVGVMLVIEQCNRKVKEIFVLFLLFVVVVCWFFCKNSCLVSLSNFVIVLMNFDFFYHSYDYRPNNIHEKITQF